MDKYTILLTGFEPFGGGSINPAALLAEALDRETVGRRRITGVVLPVSAARVPAVLEAAIERHQPEMILSLGLAGGRSGLTVERVAINVLDFENPDNDDYAATGEAIVQDGPDAYLATLPIKAIVNAWKDAGIPGGISNTAGTYICNQVLYLALHAGRRGPAGFIHLPALPEQAVTRPDVPSMTLDSCCGECVWLWRRQPVSSTKPSNAQQPQPPPPPSCHSPRLAATAPAQPPSSRRAIAPKSAEGICRPDRRRRRRRIVPSATPT